MKHGNRGQKIRDRLIKQNIRQNELVFCDLLVVRTLAALLAAGDFYCYEVQRDRPFLFNRAVESIRRKDPQTRQVSMPAMHKVWQVREREHHPPHKTARRISGACLQSGELRHAVRGMPQQDAPGEGTEGTEPEAKVQKI